MEFRDLSVFIPEHRTVVMGDLHLGYEESAQENGVLLPRFQLGDLMQRLSGMIKGAKTIVLNGDIKHEFGRILEQEWSDALRIIDWLSSRAELVIVRGNHDTMLEPLLRKKGIPLHDFHVVGSYYICHGHMLPKDEDIRDARTIIISHEHPAVTLRDGARKETYKCFLLGHYKGKNLIVLPSLNLLTYGNNISEAKRLSPLLHDISDFEVFVVSGKVMSFGKVGDL